MTTAIENLVDVEDACPVCGERDPDRLVWDDDLVRVTCTECGKVYVPSGSSPCNDPDAPVNLCSGDDVEHDGPVA